MKTSLKRILTLLVLFLFVFAAGCGVTDASLAAGDVSFQDGKLNVAFLDVGQGDSILLKSPDGKTMLIDAGEATEEEVIKSALQNNGIEKIDYLIATHPHSDHIGSMPAIVEAYEIGEIYMPRASSNTKTYEQLLENIQEKGLTVHAGRAGVTLDFGEQVQGEFLAPASEEYEETNNDSLVLKLTYGETSFLFTGDAEALSEGEMLESTPEKLDADVLKVGHHGSSSSSSTDFLLAVSPEYAVISCGKENSYGHPHAETTYSLKQLGVTTYRTDLLGTILAVSDG